MFSLAWLQQISTVQLVILYGSLEANTDSFPGNWYHHSSCYNPATGLFSFIRWPQGYALRNRVWPLGEPGHFLLLLILTHLPLQPLSWNSLHLKLPSPPGELLLRLVLEDQVECLWSLGNGRDREDGIYCILLCPDWVHISSEQGSVCFIPTSPETMDSQWMFIGWVNAWWVDELWMEIRLWEGFSSEIVSCLLLWVTRENALLRTFLWRNCKQATAIIYKCDGNCEKSERLKLYVLPTPVTLHTQLNHLAAFVSFS